MHRVRPVESVLKNPHIGLGDGYAVLLKVPVQGPDIKRGDYKEVLFAPSFLVRADDANRVALRPHAPYQVHCCNCGSVVFLAEHVTYYSERHQNPPY